MSGFSMSNSQIDVAYKECEKINQLILQEKERQQQQRKKRMEELGNNSPLYLTRKADIKDTTEKNSDLQHEDENLKLSINDAYNK